jgi:hypothetical protein
MPAPKRGACRSFDIKTITTCGEIVASTAAILGRLCNVPLRFIFLVRTPHWDGENMMIDDAAVLKRAKQLCTQHGGNWDWAGRTNSNKPVLDQMGRREYLALAWEQLLEESAGRTAQMQEAAAA